MVPLIDAVLLAATAADLRLGRRASEAHGLAAFYLAFSLAYGHRMIAWADVRFKHRYAGGPAPVKKYGTEHTRQCWSDVVRTGVACLGVVAIVAGLTWYIGDQGRTEALATNYRWAVVIFGIELLAAISYTIWPRQQPQRDGLGGSEAA